MVAMTALLDLGAALESSRSGVVAVARDDLGVLELGGADVLSYLHVVSSQHTADLRPGNATSALLLSPKGKIEFAFRLAVVEGGALLDTHAAAAHPLAERLQRFVFRYDVTVRQVAAGSGPGVTGSGAGASATAGAAGLTAVGASASAGAAGLAAVSLLGPGWGAALEPAGLPGPPEGADPLGRRADRRRARRGGRAARFPRPSGQGLLSGPGDGRQSPQPGPGAAPPRRPALRGRRAPRATDRPAHRGRPARRPGPQRRAPPRARADRAGLRPPGRPHRLAGPGRGVRGDRGRPPVPPGSPEHVTAGLIPLFAIPASSAHLRIRRTFLRSGSRSPAVGRLQCSGSPASSGPGAAPPPGSEGTPGAS